MSFLNLSTLIIFLFIFNPFPKISSAPQDEELYLSCGNDFSCGETITRIGYPFRGSEDPPYCGHPSLVLSCNDQNNATTMKIASTTYRVLEIFQATQTMRIVREDVIVTEGNICPQEMINTTLDESLFDYATSYANLTFLYGCPVLDFPGLSLVSCGINGNNYYTEAYVLTGTYQGPKDCNSSVVVPVLTSDFEAKELDHVLKQGFLIKWRFSDTDCSDCTVSNGRCGYSFESNRTTCFCPDPPYVSDACVVARVASKADVLSQGNKTNSGRNIGLFIGILVLAGVVFACLIFYYRHKRKQIIAILSSSKEIKSPTSSTSKGISSTTPPSSFSKITSSSTSNLSKDTSFYGVQVFTYTELEEATEKFNPSNELGDGGFGKVYHGVLRNGRVVAVKRLHENNFKRVEQFTNEVHILTTLRHQNLVQLYGCTSKRSRELLLVYEYVPNGTVSDHLRGKRAKSCLLSWPVRLNISIETAEAIAYLHRSGIIHRDIKTDNILLDNDFHVKVADFGMSRLFSKDITTHVSTAPQGTPGYLDPDYYQCYQLTEKSDVYSFGVVLIELLSSLQAVDVNRDRYDINLAKMALNKIQNCALHELVDARLGFETNGDVRRMMTLVSELAFRCLQQERDVRPSMDEVLAGLREIKRDDSSFHKVEIVDISIDDDRDAVLFKGSSDESPSPASRVYICGALV